MSKIEKLKAQIRVLTLKVKNNETKNIYALKGRLDKLKTQLQIEMDNFYWENFLSK